MDWHTVIEVSEVDWNRIGSKVNFNEVSGVDFSEISEVYFREVDFNEVVLIEVSEVDLSEVNRVDRVFIGLIKVVKLVESILVESILVKLILVESILIKVKPYTHSKHNSTKSEVWLLFTCIKN